MIDPGVVLVDGNRVQISGADGGVRRDDRGKASGKALSNFRQEGCATGSITGIVSLANAVPVLGLITVIPDPLKLPAASEAVGTVKVSVRDLRTAHLRNPRRKMSSRAGSALLWTRQTDFA